ncbi:hypothetical protein ACQK5W_10585 [Pantoea sp. FN060301]|uniref:hypothetical protein n=1 Tax=Pantoea sp. FN060301 TaxID=3420380 RepID=UPI003D175CD6
MSDRLKTSRPEGRLSPPILLSKHWHQLTLPAALCLFPDKSCREYRVKVLHKYGIAEPEAFFLMRTHSTNVSQRKLYKKKAQVQPEILNCTKIRKLYSRCPIKRQKAG